jgi:hypothetical protein
VRLEKAPSTPASPTLGETSFKDAFLAEVRKSKAVFYNTVVAQAQKIEIAGDRVTFVFTPAQRTLKDMFEQNRAWLETLGQQVTGRKIAVVAVQADATAPAPPPAASTVTPSTEAADKKSALREEALADSGVQALLDVFPAEIRDVEEM